MEFHIGDRVRLRIDVCTASGKMVIPAGSTGTVCDVGGPGVGVDWDEPLLYAGHGCQGRCEWGHGWYVVDSAIELQTGQDESSFTFDEDAFKSMLFDTGGG